MKILLLSLLIATLIFLSYFKIIDISLQYIIIFAIGFIILTYDCENSEYFTTNNEALLKSLSTVFNKETIEVTDLVVNGKLTIKDDRGVVKTTLKDGNVTINGLLTTIGGIDAKGTTDLPAIVARGGDKVGNNSTPAIFAIGSGITTPASYLGCPKAIVARGKDCGVGLECDNGIYSTGADIVSLNNISGKNLTVTEKITGGTLDVNGNTTVKGSITAIGGSVQARGPTNANAFVQIWASDEHSYIQSSGSVPLHLINTDLNVWTNDGKPRGFNIGGGYKTTIDDVNITGGLTSTGQIKANGGVRTPDDKAIECGYIFTYNKNKYNKFMGGILVSDGADSWEYDGKPHSGNIEATGNFKAGHITSSSDVLDIDGAQFMRDSKGRMYVHGTGIFNGKEGYIY